VATNYPNAIDSFTTKTAGAPIAESHVNNLQDAVAALQGTLGTNPQGDAATVAARLTEIATLATQAAAGALIDGSVTTVKIADEAVTGAKLGDDVPYHVLAGGQGFYEETARTSAGPVRYLAYSRWGRAGDSGAVVEYDPVTNPEGAPAADRVKPLTQTNGTTLWVKLVATGGTPDLNPPDVSAVSATAVTRTSAQILATTDETSTCIVEYGTTTAYGTASPASTGATTHSIVLSNLTPGTLYNYRVRARDVAGNLTLDTNRTFTTTAAVVAQEIAYYQPTGTFGWQYLTFGADVGADSYVEFDVEGITDQDKNCGAVFRWASGSDLVRVYISRTTWSVDGVGFFLDQDRTWAGTASSNGAGKVRIEWRGQSVTAYWNGSPIGTIDVGATAAGKTARRTGLAVWQNVASAVKITNAKSASTDSSEAPPPDDGPPPTPGTAGAAAVALWGPTRSGLPWHSGIWAGGGAQSGARMAAAGTFLGHTIDCGLAYSYPRDTWATISNTGNWGIYGNWPGKILFGLAMLPGEAAGRWDQILNGSHDYVFQGHANAALAANRGDSIIRVGWECNGNWYPWAASRSTAGDFKLAWRRIRNIMKAIAPNLKFWFDSAAASQYMGRVENVANRTLEITELYPGDDIVDGIGVDHYDFFGVKAKTNAEWANALRPAHRAGIQDYVDFARARGKPFGMPEWGTHKVDGYGDNTFFMQKMWEFFVANSDVLAYEAYFSENANYIQNAIFDPDQNPNSRLHYQKHQGRPDLYPTGAT